jgi:hypothetical protein
MERAASRQVAKIAASVVVISQGGRGLRQEIGVIAGGKWLCR